MADDRLVSKGRYRKVEVRIWGDERFRNLSRIPPSGKGLWLFLITGPHTGPIPGIFRAGRASMAEELDWEIEAFDEAFLEVFREGMAEADFKARVVWLPNALKHNRPESPNVVRSWGAEWDLIPECELKWKCYYRLKSDIYNICGEAFGKAFEEALAKPCPKAMPNQEQEQEQEQIKERGYASGDISPNPNGHDLLGEKPAEVTKAKRSIVPVQRIVDLYHAKLCPPLPTVEKITPKREGQIRQRWLQDLPDFEAWSAYFDDVLASPFLMGKVPGREGRPPFRADLEWLTNPTHFTAIAEGKYHR